MNKTLLRKGFSFKIQFLKKTNTKKMICIAIKNKCFLILVLQTFPNLQSNAHSGHDF